MARPYRHFTAQTAKSRANERRAEVAALRWPFGLPFGREHFVVARAMPSAAEIIQSKGKVTHLF